MKKLLFLVPMHITFESFTNPSDNTRSYLKKDNHKYNSLSTDLPLGPLSISAYIKKHIDIDVKLIDFNVELNIVTEFHFNNFYDYCANFLASTDFKPDIVAVSSLFSPSFSNFLDCGKAAKDVWKEAIILGGGNIPTNNSKYIYGAMDCNYFDALCYGEGEKPMLECLNATNIKKYFEESSSWFTKKKLTNNSKFIPQHNFIENLDEIPFYDYDLCDINRHGVNPATPSFEETDHRGFHIMTSRGCPYHCTFCASHRVHGREMRYHSVQRVKEDLTNLKNKYNATKVIFQDDHLMANKKRVYQILETVGDLKLGSLFQNGLTIYALNRPMLEAFYSAGVRHLVLPVESGSEKVLHQQMRKPLKFKFSVRCANDCRELGIYTNANLIIGMPGETKADMKEGLDNLRKVKANWFNIACASPLVGSEMHELAVKKEYIKESTMGSDFHHAVIETEDFTPEYVQQMEYTMNLELNFVYNNDIEVGEYELALRGFMNVIRVRPDLAFAHYFAAMCYKQLGKQKLFKKHRKLFLEHSQTTFWKAYCYKYDLSQENLDEITDGSKPSKNSFNRHLPDKRLALKYGTY